MSALYMHAYPGNWMAMGRAVVYFARAAHVSSAGIKRVQN